MSKEITVTLRSAKGTEWQLKATQEKLATIKRNAKRMGIQIVRVA